MGDLREPVDEKSYFVSEVRLDGVEINQRVLDDVVQEAGRHTYCVQPQIGKNVGDLQRMYEIRFARSSLLSPMVESRKQIRPPDQIDICIRAVGLHFLNDVFNADHPSAKPILQSNARQALFFSLYDREIFRSGENKRRCSINITEHHPLIRKLSTDYFLVALVFAFAFAASSSAARRASTSS